MTRSKFATSVSIHGHNTIHGRLSLSLSLERDPLKVELNGSLRQLVSGEWTWPLRTCTRVTVSLLTRPFENFRKTKQKNTHSPLDLSPVIINLVSVPSSKSRPCPSQLSLSLLSSNNQAPSPFLRSVCAVTHFTCGFSHLTPPARVSTTRTVLSLWPWIWEMERNGRVWRVACDDGPKASRKSQSCWNYAFNCSWDCY